MAGCFCLCLPCCADVCTHLKPREATDEELLAVHSPGLAAAVAALSHANQPSDLNQVAAHLAPDMLGNRWDGFAACTAYAYHMHQSILLRM